MYKGSSQSQSGLRAVKRDFSSTPQSSQDTLKSSQSSAPLKSNNVNKRPATSSSDQPPAKKRQLPWDFKTPQASDLKTAVAQRTQPTISQNSRDASASQKSGVSKVFLSKEQTQILKLVEQGHSVFYTGSAGTGKSVLLREIIKTMRQKHAPARDAVAITASTGIAACNIGGVTIHSFAGIGLGTGTVDELYTRVNRNRKAAPRWSRTKTLIIDEVSMVDGDLFDKLAALAKRLRKSGEPFGGIQLIVTGDFFQLPPVMKGAAAKFAFEAQAWTECIKRTFNLTKVFRQKDQGFVDMLNEMRFGQLSQQSIAKFKSLSRDIESKDGIAATELFPRREDVDMSNRSRMGRLTAEEKVYVAKDSGSAEQEQREKILSNCMAPKEIKLRVGAQVMLIKNTEDMNLVNGTLGKVIAFVDAAQEKGGDVAVLEGPSRDGKPKAKPVPKGPVVLFPLVEFILPNRIATQKVIVMPESWKVELPSGEIQAQRTQLPLILAWAMSIHKSQGQTLDRVKVDLGKVFEKGQAYVALSRATSMEGLQVLNFNPAKVQAHPKVVAWSKTLEILALD